MYLYIITYLTHVYHYLFMFYLTPVYHDLFDTCISWPFWHLYIMTYSKPYIMNYSKPVYHTNLTHIYHYIFITCITYIIIYLTPVFHYLFNAWVLLPIWLVYHYLFHSPFISSLRPMNKTLSLRASYFSSRAWMYSLSPSPIFSVPRTTKATLSKCSSILWRLWTKISSTRSSFV